MNATYGIGTPLALGVLPWDSTCSNISSHLDNGVRDVCLAVPRLPGQGYARVRLAYLGSGILGKTLHEKLSHAGVTVAESPATDVVDASSRFPNESGFDGGDCCPCTCINTTLARGDKFPGGFECVDPSARQRQRHHQS